VTRPAFAKASDFASVFVVATTDRCASSFANAMEDRTPDKSADKSA